MRRNKDSIIPIFFTVFLDLLGLGIVIPILPAVILDPINGVIPSNYGFSARTLIYGFLIASYPIAQFFGAPVLGTLADNKGRKRLLVFSLFGTFAGYIMFATGILQKNIFLLFAGRILDGFTGGNISIAQSAIADISDEGAKSRNFGLVGMAFGLGFVIGPYIGGNLADSSIIGWFDYSTPFWFSAILTIINILLVLNKFPETLRKKRAVKISILTGFRNIQRAISFKNLRTMLVVWFFLTIGFNFFTQFFQVFLMSKFKFSQSNVGDFFAYIGIWIALGQGIIMRPLSKLFIPENILRFSIILLAGSFLLLLLPDKTIWLFIIAPLVAIFRGLTQPNTTAIISDMGTTDNQGELLGINQSITSLAQAVPPIIAGFSTSINVNAPIIFAAAANFIAWCIFILFFSKNQRKNKI